MPKRHQVRTETGLAVAKSKQSRSREFSRKAREEIAERDGGQCIFCMMGYHMEKADYLGLQIKSIMHYIPRSANGLGIPRNGAVGCQYHHEMMDNGKEGRREEMLGKFKEYLMDQYGDWNEDGLRYSKWNFLEK